MAERNIWVERKFNFNLPAWMYCNIVERVRGGPARVEDIVRGLNNTTLTSRIKDRWSIQEHIGHLLDLESLWSTRLDELTSKAKHLTAWEETNSATYQADHNSSSLEEILTTFRETRAGFVERLDSLDSSLVEQTALHPRLQTPMRTIDLVFFVAEHDDHHLAQITLLKKELS